MSKIEIFVSYTHCDVVWLNRLRPLLQFDHCKEAAYHWDDRQMKPGDRWDLQIRESLERMRVFICLLSVEFLTSRYVRTVELPRAIEREQEGQIRIVPIVIYRNLRIEEECHELHQFQRLPAWDKCWRDFEVEHGDYGDAHGLIRSGLREAITQALAITTTESKPNSFNPS